MPNSKDFQLSTRNITKKIKKIWNNAHLRLLILIFFISILPMFILSFQRNQSYRETIYEERKLALQDHMDITLSYLDTIYSNLKDGIIANTSEAQTLAIEHIKKLRYGPANLDYFWIQSTENGSYILVMHPYFQDPSDPSLSEQTQAVMQQAYQEVSQTDSTPGEGFIEYMWPYYNDSSQYVLKLSFVKEFSEWNWIIGSGMYLNDVDSIINRRVWYDMSIFLSIYGVFAIINILSLIHQHRRQLSAKQELKYSQSKYQTLVTQMNEALAQTNPKGELVYANTQFTELLGYKPEEYLGHKVTEFLTGKSQKIFKKEIAQRPQGYQKRYQITWIAKDGTHIATLISPTALFNPEGHFIGSYGLMTDITELKKTQQILREERGLLELTLKQIRDGVIVTDEDGRIILINKSGAQITEWTPSEAYGKPLFDILKISPSDLEIFPIDALNLSDERSHINSTQTLSLVSKSNKEKLIRMHATPILEQDENIKGIVVIFRDVTQSKKFEENIYNSQKVESLSIIAAGIAHDFNNYLTSIIGNLSIAKFEIKDEDSELLKIINDAESASLDAKSLSNQLLSFTTQQESPTKEIELFNLVKKNTDFVLRGTNCKAVYKFDSNIDSIEGYPTQLNQLFQNIVINAQQAMEQGGIIKIMARTRFITFESKLPLPAGNYIEIQIQDQGHGISPDNLKQLFTPFFTTKRHGHGLGLTVCFSIVKKHGGHIYADSKIGKGTTFYILLPKSEKKQTSQQVHVNNLQFGTESILILEDQPNIQETFRRIFNFLGYKAIIHNKSDLIISAYQKALEHQEKFDLVILDLTIPGDIGAEQVIKKLQKIDPDVNAIVTSGFATDPVIMHYKDFGFQGVLLKPFTIEDISELLRHS